MATIYKELQINASPDFVWNALRDVGNIHKRLAKGFVTNTTLDGEVRTVTFSNGLVVRERIVSVSDKLRRLVYSYVGGRTSHSNGSFQVFDNTNGTSRILWIIDLLPEEALAPIERMVELAMIAIKQTLEQSSQ